MKRISPEKIAGICGKFQRPENKKEGLHLLADWGAEAQLESCEAELIELKKEWAREMVDKLEKYHTDAPFHNFSVYITEEEWQSLKSKLLGEE